MGRPQETFNKKELEKKRIQKRKEKLQRMEERKANSKKGASLDDMMAYVDENGMLTSTPPDKQKKKEIKAENIEVGIPKREDREEDNDRVGILSYFNDEKGYGFIQDSETKMKYFVHMSNFMDDIIQGNKVLYETEKGRKGPVATKVRLQK